LRALEICCACASGVRIPPCPFLPHVAAIAADEGHITMQKPQNDFISIYASNDQGEIAFVKSILDEAGIQYYVTNENLRTLIGAVGAFSTSELKVEKERFEEAKELLKDFLESNRG
jgi:hypothetical protein